MTNTPIDRFLEQALRKGVVPVCCTGASFCFALYSFKVASAAQAWIKLNHNDSIITTTTHNHEFSRHGMQLQQHAGTCAALSAISFATALEAFRDWRGYRSLLSLDEMERWIWYHNRVFPFFARLPVLTTAIVSLFMVKSVSGGILFAAPRRPAILIVKKKEQPVAE